MKEGKIIFRKYTELEGKNIFDIKKGGHPTLNVLEKDGYTYYFIISSKIRKNTIYFHLYPSRKNHLTRDSYINLSYVYKEKTNVNYTYGKIGKYQMLSIYEKFIRHHEAGTIFSNIEEQHYDLKMLYEEFNQIVMEEKYTPKEKL